MKKLLIFLFVTIAAHLQAQDFCNSLYGFRLRQYREAVKTELGKPFQSGKYEDGFEYEAYLLRPDTSLYIIFEYAAQDTNLIWSIQVTGVDFTDVLFKGLKLGVDKSQVEKILGKPSAVENINEYGQKWEYDKTNFSVEVSTKGKLSSIKILDNSYELFPKGPDVKKIPTFNKIRQVLTSNNNAAMLQLLAGDIELYYNNKTWYFKRSFLAEQTADHSGLLSIIKTISKDLATVNPANDKAYEESMRLTTGEYPKHVIKFKTGHMIREIVLKYFGGQYYIYEINASGK